MTLAQQIRDHVLARHIEPARSAGREWLTVRAGDIHSEMKLHSRMPAVCSALAGAPLQELAGVQLIERVGPQQGANVHFTYLITHDACSNPALQPTPEPRHCHEGSSPAAAASFLGADRFDFGQALVLISRTKSKLSTGAPAADLYTSSQFRLAKQLMERRGLSWRVLSARHGLIHPDEWIEPYDETLNSMPMLARRAWSDRVLSKLVPLASEHNRVVFLAGAKYREFLMPMLDHAGIETDAPLARLTQGRQLAWLAAQ